MLPSLGEQGTPQLKATLFCKTQKEAGHPRNQSAVSRQHGSFLSVFLVLRLWCEWVSGLKLSRPEVCTDGARRCHLLVIASFLSRDPGPALKSLPLSWLCRGSVCGVSPTLEAARTLRAGEFQPTCSEKWHSPGPSVGAELQRPVGHGHQGMQPRAGLGLHELALEQTCKGKGENTGLRAPSV